VRYKSLAVVQVDGFFVANFDALMIAFEPIETIARRPMRQGFDLKAVHLMLGCLVPSAVNFDMYWSFGRSGVQAILLWSGLHLPKSRAVEGS
jgi:hypothetical protein